MHSKILRSFFIGLVSIGTFFAATHSVSAATNIYYSVGSNTTSHLTGTGVTVTIDGSGNATFSTAQTSNSTGIGDVVVYGGSKAYITGKVSTSVWTVATATGTLPVATTSAPVTSIAHVFSHLSSALNSNAAGNATSSSLLNTADLVAGNYILNIALYNDTGTADTGNVAISGYTTGPSNYIRLYTPTSTVSEVNQSQRHNGTYNTAVGYALQMAVNGALINISNSYTRIDGIQIKNTTATRSDIGYSSITTDDRYVSNSIIVGSGDNANGIDSTSSGTGVSFHYFNNIFQSLNTGIKEAGANYATSTVLNNTIYDANIGINPYPNCNFSYHVEFVNNLFASTSYPFTNNSCRGVYSGYNSTASTSLGYAGGSNYLGNDLVGQTISFYDAPNGNFSLTGSDVAARDFGTSSPSTDTFFPFSTDILGATRPSGSAWDIGAFEYTPAPDTAPPGISGGSPSGQIAKDTTSVAVSVNTNENATCKYSTTAGTAYSSMTNTFTTTGSMAHSFTLTGAQNGHIYNYYVRCQDSSGNADTSDYTVSFEVNQGTNGTVYAASCSVADTNAAMAYVNDGDTLSIPAGTCTGYSSSSGLGVGKSITVKGAGIDQTILQIASTTGTYSSPVFPMTAAATFRDMTVTTESSGNCGTAFNPQVSGFRITNLKYLCNSITPNGYFVYPNSTGTTGIYGLIDHVDVTGGNGNNELVFVRGPTNSWQMGDSKGTANAVYIEDSTFRGPGYVTDCNANSRCVVRDTTITGDMKIDGHGPESNSPGRGMRHFEIYNNTWTSSDLAWTAIEMRSGSGIIFNNSAPNQTPGGNQARFYLHDYAYYDGSFSWAPYGNVPQCPSNYPILDQIGVGMDPKSAASDPFYLWGNTLGGIQWQLNWKDISSAASTYCANTYSDTGYTLQNMIKYNREYYTSSTSVAFDGTAGDTSSGVGSGLYSAMPATCTTGVAYWATDKGGNWDATNGSTNDGALYKCTATNTWNLSYTPYAYPHYLTAASTTASDQVDIGGGARFFGTGKFYAVSTSTMSGVYATFGATTTPVATTAASSSADYWLDVSISAWSNSGTHHKAWTETSTTLGATTTHHMIGDLAANTAYTLKIDNAAATSNITSSQCSSGTCTSDSSGKIYFDYTGGYSTHTFDLVQGSAATAPALLAPVLNTISASGATASSTVTDVGGSNATSTGFVYGLTSAYGATTTPSTGSFAAGTVLSSSLTGLACNTTYHVAAFATNANGIGYSSDATFTTSSCSLPTVVGSANSIGQTSVTFGGTVSATGGANATSTGFVYGLTSAYGATTTPNVGSFGAGSSISGSASGLSCNTTYHFAAFATNSVGIGYSPDATFTTSACISTLTTSSASSVSQTSASLNGSISATGGANATESGFAWGTGSSLSGGDTATTTLGAQTGTASFSSSVSSLSCNTAYYFRAYATNTGGTGYGSIQTFTTSACSAPAPTSSSSSSSLSRRSRESRDVTVSGTAGEPVTVQSSATSTTSVATSSEPVATSTPESVPTISASLPPSLSSFIELMISLGIIPENKADIARKAISAPAPSSVSVPSHDLQYHDKGSDVLSLQKVLVSKGYLKAAPNGVFGPATFAALKAYQKDHGVPPTGYYGPLTRAALE